MSAGDIVTSRQSDIATAQQPNSPTAQQPNSPTAQQPNSPTVRNLPVDPDCKVLVSGHDQELADWD